MWESASDLFFTAMLSCLRRRRASADAGVRS